MNQTEKFVKLQLLATTAMPKRHVSASIKVLLFGQRGPSGWTGCGSGPKPVKKILGWVGGRFGVIKTQRPTHPPLERNF